MKPVSAAIWLIVLSPLLASVGRPIALAQGNSVCAHWCTANFAPGAARGACVSDAAHSGGACFACGPAGTNVGLCGSVCCAGAEVCVANVCARLTPTPTPIPTATSTVTTLYQTRVIGSFNSTVEYDSTFAAPPPSIEVQQGFDAARQSVTNACSNSCTGSCSVGSPILVASMQSNGTSFSTYMILGSCMCG